VDEGGHRIDESILAGLPGAIVTVMEEAIIPGTVARLASSGVGVRAVQRVAPSLEDLFLGLTEGEGIA